MRKSKQQLRYERELYVRQQQLRSRGIAHPAEPVGHDGMWRTKCERRECNTTFFTVAKQRRFCSDACRRLVQAAADRDRRLREHFATKVCAAGGCGNRFVPKRRGHRFCSSNCRQKGYRQAGDLSPIACARCGASIASMTARARYCSARCRVAEARRRKSRCDEHLECFDANFSLIRITNNRENK